MLMKKTPIEIPNFSDEEILKNVLSWKQRQRLSVEDVWELLQIKRQVYYNRVHKGGWKRKEVARMMKIGVLPQEVQMHLQDVKINDDGTATGLSNEVRTLPYRIEDYLFTGLVRVHPDHVQKSIYATRWNAYIDAIDGLDHFILTKEIGQK